MRWKDGYEENFMGRDKFIRTFVDWWLAGESTCRKSCRSKILCFNNHDRWEWNWRRPSAVIYWWL